jgi:hypothetical protein
MTLIGIPENGMLTEAEMSGTEAKKNCLEATQT